MRIKITVFIKSSYQLSKFDMAIECDLTTDGDMFSVVAGGVAEGIAGFGVSPEEAVKDFISEFKNTKIKKAG